MAGRIGTLVLTAFAMIAFAANSVLCRLALADPLIDPASFTSVRLLSGAAMLLGLVALQRGPRPRDMILGEDRRGSWRAAAALFVYAATFSFAYVTLDAATGALILFGAVQATMIGAGLWQGERLTGMRLRGAIVAGLGVLVLVAPGAGAPAAFGAFLMTISGVAWGLYSLQGRSMAALGGDATQNTAGNFLRAAPMALGLLLLSILHLDLSLEGMGYAVASGALASGAGYAIWYMALRGLGTTEASVVQLTVPALAAAGGVVLLGESISLRLILASLAILGGVAAVLTARPRAVEASRSSG